MALLYINKVKGDKVAFEAKVRDIAQKLGVKPEDLMIVMDVESGLNPQAQNTTFLVEGKPATGLIQFVNSTAISLGTTIEALYAMTGVQQLDFVYKYFQPYAGRIKGVEDLYLITFFPAALGYSDDQQIGTSSISPRAVAASNPAIDLNKDGVITVGEFKTWVRKKLPIGYQSGISRDIMYAVSPVTDSPFVVWGIVILFGVLIYLLYRRATR